MTKWLIVITVAVFFIDGFSARIMGRPAFSAHGGLMTDWGHFSVATGLHKFQIWRFISFQFLHAGLPRMKLTAVWEEPRSGSNEPRDSANLARDLLDLLGDPNIASKEHLVRQYDHEVQAQSVIKPFAGIECDAPS
ncbi:MAG: hypothetical protein QF735_04370, partial [Phycisphaeraceae bacterium]|nr:hypothetical protein [Phycisphaeraceae bacterium]